MSQTELPFTSQRGAALQLIVPILLVEPLIVGGVFFYLYQSGAIDAFVALTAFVIFLIGGIAAVVFLIRTLQPAGITLDRSMVSVCPLPLLGIATRAVAHYPLSSFTRIEVVAAQGKSPAVCLLVSKDGTDRSIRFPPPRGMTAAEAVAQLNRLLGFKS